MWFFVWNNLNFFYYKMFIVKFKSSFEDEDENLKSYNVNKDSIKDYDER